jgi:hypothetical protein
MHTVAMHDPDDAALGEVIALPESIVEAPSLLGTQPPVDRDH